MEEKRLIYENKVECPYKCGDVCNADIGKPIKVKDGSNLAGGQYPYAYILNLLWESNVKMSSKVETIIELGFVLLLMVILLSILLIVR